MNSILLVSNLNSETITLFSLFILLYVYGVMKRVNKYLVQQTEHIGTDGCWQLGPAGHEPPE